MSRIGKNPIPVANGVDVAIKDGEVRVKGPQGELTMRAHPDVGVEFDSAARQIKVTRSDDQPQSRALHGLTRALVANMVEGVQKPYVKQLEIQGAANIRNVRPVEPYKGKGIRYLGEQIKRKAGKAFAGG
jgi:large subunit ribosomal protein L6